MAVGKRCLELLSIVPQMLSLVDLPIDNVMGPFQGTIRCTDVEDELEALRLSWGCLLVSMDGVVSPGLLHSFPMLRVLSAMRAMKLLEAHLHLPSLKLLPFTELPCQRSHSPA